MNLREDRSMPSPARGALDLRLARGLWVPGVLLSALLAALYWDVVPAMVHIWLTDDAYSHGMLIPPLAAYIAWMDRDRILAVRVGADSRGLLLTALGCIVLVVGRLGAEFFLSRISIVLILGGLVWTFWGPLRLRALAFPLILLATMVPIPTIVYNLLAAPMQLFATGVSSNVLEMMGVPVFRDGNIIHLAQISLGVAEACSGLRSVSSLAVLALVVGYFQASSSPIRVFLFLLSFPIAVALNVVRIVGTAVVAPQNPELAAGFFHSFSGWIVFLIGFGLLYLAASALAAVERKKNEGTQ